MSRETRPTRSTVPVCTGTGTGTVIVDVSQGPERVWLHSCSRALETEARPARRVVSEKAKQGYDSLEYVG